MAKSKTLKQLLVDIKKLEKKMENSLKRIKAEKKRLEWLIKQ